MASEIQRIAVIGLGHVGCPLAVVMADRGHQILGIDRRSDVVEMIARGQAPLSEPGLKEILSKVVESGDLRACGMIDELDGVDTVILTVGTPIDDAGNADLSALEAVCRDIGPHLTDRQLVILKSTVPPGTTEDLVAPILSEHAQVDIAFCPERMAEGQALRDLTSLPVIVGGLTQAATDRAREFFRAALGVECIPVSSARAAELVKLADNLWIDLNIALANELGQLSDALGLDVLEVIAAANTLSKGGGRVNILTPSLGVGGSCLTKDPLFLAKLANEHEIDMTTPAVSRRINDSMPAYSVGRIRNALKRARPGMSADRLKIAVLGIAFKNDTSDCRNSPTKPAIEALIEHGYALSIHDPLVKPSDARLVTELPLEASLDDAMEGADCVAFFTGHRVFAELTPEDISRRAAPGAAVFDGRMFFPREFIDALQSLGLTYVGVGRG